MSAIKHGRVTGTIVTNNTGPTTLQQQIPGGKGYPGYPIGMGQQIHSFSFEIDKNALRNLSDHELDTLRNYTLGAVLHFKIAKTINMEVNKELLELIDAEIVERTLLRE